LSPKSRANGPALYIVRHGDTAANDPKEEKFRSWDNEIGINHHGQQHAKQAAALLADTGCVFLATSDLKRAEQTAVIVGKALGLDPVSDHTLRDWNLGIFIGQPVKEFLPQIKHFEEALPNKALPEGESYNTFYKRFSDSLFRYLHAVEAMGVSGAIISHQRCLYTVPNILTNGAAPVKWGGPPDPGGVVRLRPNSQKVELL
jgi:broad specificity phosphatase PhoE